MAPEAGRGTDAEDVEEPWAADTGLQLAAGRLGGDSPAECRAAPGRRGEAAMLVLGRGVDGLGRYVPVTGSDDDDDDEGAPSSASTAASASSSTSPFAFRVAPGGARFLAPVAAARRPSKEQTMDHILGEASRWVDATGDAASELSSRIWSDDETWWPGAAQATRRRTSSKLPCLCHCTVSSGPTFEEVAAEFAAAQRQAAASAAPLIVEAPTAPAAVVAAAGTATAVLTLLESAPAYSYVARPQPTTPRCSGAGGKPEGCRAPPESDLSPPKTSPAGPRVTRPRTISTLSWADELEARSDRSSAASSEWVLPEAGDRAATYRDVQVQDVEIRPAGFPFDCLYQEPPQPKAVPKTMAPKFQVKVDSSIVPSCWLSCCMQP